MKIRVCIKRFYNETLSDSSFNTSSRILLRYKYRCSWCMDE